MNTQFKQRFEKGIAEFNLSLTKKRGVKTLAKVAERIGKLRQKYPSIYRYYDIDIEEENGIVSNIKLTEKESKPIEGHYLLRTTLNEKDEATKWKIYNVIREVEATFKILKTDLDLRPVYHKTDSACEAHLHLGILAYSIVNTIRYQLKKVNDNRSWKAIVAQMNTHKIITTKLPCADGKIIYIRKFSEPSLNVKATYDVLNYKQRQFIQKKVVVTPQQLVKNDLAENQHFRSG